MDRSDILEGQVMKLTVQIESRHIGQLELVGSPSKLGSD